ncbi:acetylornithine deacetylase (plasmid) [Deinococcus aetherius]|uniref:Acetylornithine deacetylase n=1 Tax=Deinococcus aetherius TaxID=200252 RepID=A0ABM8AKM7_9DEIO|nr:M20/M25/M40 family metallo-hydrolase [Deinococcus aetherius]BDP44373.1 acetylornithine deacetylase [Deinococcus aetherius]
MTDLARALVRLDTQAPLPGEAVAASFLEPYLRERGFAVTRQEVAPGRPNLIADLGTGTGGLILEGHTDVVSVGDPGGWTIPPFEGRIENGLLHGRGSADMKAGLAAAICAAVAVRQVMPDPPRPLRLAILCDEEGLMLGVKAFVRAGYTRGFAGAIICEPEENEVCLCQKGAMRVWVNFQGRMAHGAMPYAGVNPIPAAAAFVSGLAALEEDWRDARHDLLGEVYLTPTVFEASAGPGQNNVIPGACRVGLDIRTVPGVDHALLSGQVEDLLRAVLRDFAGISAALDIYEDRPATETALDAPVVQSVVRALELTGQPVRYGGVPGATDGTFLHAWAGLPIVTLGPGDRTIPHQVNEHVSLKAVVDATRIYAAAATLFLMRAA